MKSYDELLEEITEKLVKEFNPERIFLFGSHAWGTPNKDSDFDLLVIVKESSLRPARRASLAHHCLWDIPYPLDILVKTVEEVDLFSKVPAALEYKILNQGRLLYG